MGKSRLGGKNVWVRGDDGGGGQRVCVCTCVEICVYIRYPIRVRSVDIDHVQLMLSCANNENGERVLWH